MPRKNLNASVICEAAAVIADQEGLDQVTMLKVAGSLGVRSPSLFNHIKGLKALKRKLIILGAVRMNEFLKASVPKAAGREKFLAIAKAYRNFALKHPGLYESTVCFHDPEDQEVTKTRLVPVQFVIATLQIAHLSEDDQIHQVRAFRSILHGFVDLEHKGGFQLGTQVEESFEHMLSIFYKNLDHT